MPITESSWAMDTLGLLRSHLVLLKHVRGHNTTKTWGLCQLTFLYEPPLCKWKQNVPTTWQFHFLWAKMSVSFFEGPDSFIPYEDFLRNSISPMVWPLDFFTDLRFHFHMLQTWVLCEWLSKHRIPDWIVILKFWFSTVFAFRSL